MYRTGLAAVARISLRTATGNKFVKLAARICVVEESEVCFLEFLFELVPVDRLKSSFTRISWEVDTEKSCGFRAAFCAAYGRWRASSFFHPPANFLNVRCRAALRASRSLSGAGAPRLLGRPF